MTKYCPFCESEFQDSLQVCPDDNNKLFESKVSIPKRKEMVDLYAAASEIEAEVIVGLLSDEGLGVRLFRPQISQFPTLTDNQFIVAVTPDHKERATELLKQARDDSIISDLGAFI